MNDIIIPLQRLEKGITTTDGFGEIKRLDGFLDTEEILQIQFAGNGISIVFGEKENLSTSIDQPCTGLPRIIQADNSEKALVVTPLGDEAYAYVIDLDIEKDKLFAKFLETVEELFEAFKFQINDDPNRQVLIYTDRLKERPPAVTISRFTNTPRVGIELLENIPYFVFSLNGFEYKIRTGRRGGMRNFGQEITTDLVKTNYLEFLEMLFLMEYIITNNKQE